MVPWDSVMRCNFERYSEGVLICNVCQRRHKTQWPPEKMYRECVGANAPQEEPAQKSTRPTKGPGTELKRLLGKFGIKAAPNCACNARAGIMDEHGGDWCEANIEVICDWLEEEATRRKLPFVRTLGRLLVRRAIKNARKAEAKCKT